jgi:hypothetical protein
MEMNYQIKLFHWPERGDHVIMIVRGFVEIEGFKQMFRKVGEMTQELSNCKVLVDLIDATHGLDPVSIKDFVSEMTPELWPANSKIALVSTPQIQLHNQLLLLAASLSNRGYKIAAFYDSKAAVSWLTENF